MRKSNDMLLKASVPVELLIGCLGLSGAIATFASLLVSTPPRPLLST